MTRSFTGLFYACITAVLWGVLAVVLKVSLKKASPVDITWFRFTLAFLGLALYYYRKKPVYLRIIKKPPLLLIIASICLGINYIGFIKGVHLTSPGTAQLFIQSGPVLLAVSGFLFFKEKIVIRQIIGLLLVVSGLFLFYSEQNNCITSTPAAYKTGIGWVFLAAISWAVYAILIKLLVQKHPPMQLNLVIFGLPALLYFPFVNLSVFFHLSVVDWLIMIFLGLNTLVAYGTLALAIQYTEAKKVSVILILNPLITMGIMGIIGLTKATWITHEKYTLISIIGALTMLSGAIFTILKPKEKIVLPPD